VRALKKEIGSVEPSEQTIQGILRASSGEKSVTRVERKDKGSDAGLTIFRNSGYSGNAGPRTRGFFVFFVLESR